MQTPSTTLPHSGLGIASFITSLVAGALLLLIFGITGVLGSQAGGLDGESAAAQTLGLFLLLMVLAQLAALGLGIAGLAQTGRSKLFGALGTAFASTALLGTLILTLAGVAIGS